MSSVSTLPTEPGGRRLMGRSSTAPERCSNLSGQRVLTRFEGTVSWRVFSYRCLVVGSIISVLLTTVIKRLL